MYHNPDLMTRAEAISATEVQLLHAQYEFMVASVSLAFALVFMYFLFKTLVWFLPKIHKLQRDEK